MCVELDLSFQKRPLKTAYVLTYILFFAACSRLHRLTGSHKRTLRLNWACAKHEFKGMHDAQLAVCCRRLFEQNSLGQALPPRT